MIGVLNGGVVRGGAIRGAVVFDGAAGPTGPPVLLNPGAMFIAIDDPVNQVGAYINLITAAEWRGAEFVSRTWLYYGPYVGAQELYTGPLELSDQSLHDADIFLSEEATNAAGTSTEDSNSLHLDFTPVIQNAPEIVGPVYAGANVELTEWAYYNNYYGAVYYLWFIDGEAYAETNSPGVDLPPDCSGKPLYCAIVGINLYATSGTYLTPTVTIL
ncbi:hypothetical protein [Luteolibacter sp. LG18]|uniref:hypothetical protein n=1 Tax=Luteolibacter sp. LG18 TaxID=2819286 RepID=UPI002B308355|nr:hypothetical protein llg_26500 [Luteolibacter sp. LG18]